MSRLVPLLLLAAVALGGCGPDEPGAVGPEPEVEIPPVQDEEDEDEDEEPTPDPVDPGPECPPGEPEAPGGYDGDHGGSGGDEPEPDPDPDPEPLVAWGPAVVTLYTFQDNSACNSTMTASGLPLVPYVSVALPFRYLVGLGGGPFSMGETIHVDFLEGRAMPDGGVHSGWVRIDDFCGDGGDDSYCLQGGLPNVDLYVGDWAASGMTCQAADPDAWGTGWFSGPGGDGAEPAVVSFGPAPQGEPAGGYGGAAMGQGDCGDCAFGRTVQPPACWHYDPGSENVQYCDCGNSNGVDGECP